MSRSSTPSPPSQLAFLRPGAVGIELGISSRTRLLVYPFLHRLVVNDTITLVPRPYLTELVESPALVGNSAPDRASSFAQTNGAAKLVLEVEARLEALREYHLKLGEGVLTARGVAELFDRKVNTETTKLWIAKLSTGQQDSGPKGFDANTITALYRWERPLDLPDLPPPSGSGVIDQEPLDVTALPGISHL